MTAFHGLIEEQIPRPRRYARALTRNLARSDDLAQDTLARAIAKEHLWQPGTNLRAWLFTLMHNQHVNNVRRTAASLTVELDAVSSSLMATTDPTSSRQPRELDRALSQLPDEQRQTILLVGPEGMSYQEAAEIFNVPVGTVRSRLSRGRDNLSRLMDLPERAGTGPTELAA